MSCGIFGAIGPKHWEGKHDLYARFLRLRENVGDRGRDGVGVMNYETTYTNIILGNYRATPTPEAQHGRLQPYDGIVHNGTIANAEALGLREGEIDSEVLPRVLSRYDFPNFATGLRKLQGSYAIIAKGRDRLFLARNYKPLYMYYFPEYSVWFVASMARHFKGVSYIGTAPIMVPAYSTMELTGPTMNILLLPREHSSRTLVVCSGGLDSVTVATKYVREGHDVRLLHYDYGCRATKPETHRIPTIAEALHCEYAIVPLSYEQLDLLPHVGDKATTLLDETTPLAGAIEGAEFAHEWVPARNLLMVAHATAYAEAHGFGIIALGTNLEESGAYPDNEEEFIYHLDRALELAVHDGGNIRLEAPLGNLMKHEIVKLGLELDAPYHLTWSCYTRGPHPCHNCSPCFMREEAFRRNDRVDPLIEGVN